MSRRNNQPFDMGQWCDYVRGLLDEETEHEMRRILDSSAEARERVAALDQVATLAAFEREHAPPEWAVRSAKALASMGRRDAPSTWLQRLAMAVSFDSLATPALAGTRDVQTLDRQMIFDAADHRVDLRIEPEADFQGAVYVGQLMYMGETVEPVADVPVLAVRGDEILGQARTGPFGEFQASGLPGSNLGLRLILADETCLELEVGHNDLDGNHLGESL